MLLLFIVFSPPQPPSTAAGGTTLRLRLTDTPVLITSQTHPSTPALTETTTMSQIHPSTPVLKMTPTHPNTPALTMTPTHPSTPALTETRMTGRVNILLTATLTVDLITSTVTVTESPDLKKNQAEHRNIVLSQF